MTKMIKKLVGRPESAIPTKQINVRMSLSKLENSKLKERIKYTSFSQYVNSLIDADLLKEEK